MSTITAAAVTPVGGPFVTNPAYSGTFIPTLWSAKLNAKFYAASVFADICNRDWEGEIANLGDKVIINNIPSISINDYVVGGNLSYQVPTDSAVELAIERAKSFGFTVSDVLEKQSKPNLIDMFSSDAAEQMRTVIDSTCIYRTFNQASANNMGTTAGVKSAGYSLGSDTAPIAINSTSGSPDNILTKILQMASVLDEQNVPDSGRWLVLDPLTRTILMNTNLAQAQFMGDDKSMVRNGLIGTIDRFKVYVSNQLPTAANGTSTPWVSGDGSENSVTSSGTTPKRRAIIAGHPSAIAFASQMIKTETLRNPTDFGDVVRGLQVFGHKVVQPKALAMMIVA
jgi:hypothetical protein